MKLRILDPQIRSYYTCTYNVGTFYLFKKYLIQSLRRSRFSIAPRTAEVRRKIILLNLSTSRKRVQTLGRDIFHLPEVGDTPARQKLRVCDIRHTLRLAGRKNAATRSSFIPASFLSRFASFPGFLGFNLCATRAAPRASRTMEKMAMRMNSTLSYVESGVFAVYFSSRCTANAWHCVTAVSPQVNISCFRTILD